MDGYDLINLRREIREFCQSVLSTYKIQDFSEVEFFQILKESLKFCKQERDEENAGDKDWEARQEEYNKIYDSEFDDIAKNVITMLKAETNSEFFEDQFFFDSLENFKSNKCFNYL